VPEEGGRRWEDTRKAWDEVGERFAEVGRQVSERYRSLEQETGQTTERTGQTVRDAVQGVIQQLDQAFTSVGDTMRDPQAKESLRQAVHTFGQALEATVSELTKERRGPESKSDSGS
jgi:hypothetical protein